MRIIFSALAGVAIGGVILAAWAWVVWFGKESQTEQQRQDELESIESRLAGYRRTLRKDAG